MKIIFDSKEKTTVLFEKPDEPISLLAKLAEEREQSFHFSMIGGCSEVELAYYDFSKKDYFTKTFNSQNFEVLSINGNAGWHEGKPMIHAHGVFGDDTYATFGGHIMRMTISAVGETEINWLPQKLEKKTDAASGLKLFCPI